jgi:hypothetical protein
MQHEGPAFAGAHRRQHSVERRTFSMATYQP